MVVEVWIGEYKEKNFPMYYSCQNTLYAGESFRGEELIWDKYNFIEFKYLPAKKVDKFSNEYYNLEKYEVTVKEYSCIMIEFTWYFHWKRSKKEWSKERWVFHVAEEYDRKEVKHRLLKSFKIIGNLGTMLMDGAGKETLRGRVWW